MRARILQIFREQLEVNHDRGKRIAQLMRESACQFGYLSDRALRFRRLRLIWLTCGHPFRDGLHGGDPAAATTH